MLAEGGDPEQVPPTIQALLAARLDTLPEEERDCSSARPSSGSTSSGRRSRELTADAAPASGAQLAALVRKELIRPHEAIEDTFRFRHMLIRDAAYERIPKELRSELHERFAGWLDGRGEELEEIVGYHLEQAYRCLAGSGRPATARRHSPTGRGAALRVRAAGVRPRRLRLSGESARARRLAPPHRRAPPGCAFSRHSAECSAMQPDERRRGDSL